MRQDCLNNFPDYPPESREERMRILMSIRDEDIDCSDMPELTEVDFARGTRMGGQSGKSLNNSKNKGDEKSASCVYIWKQRCSTIILTETGRDMRMS